MIEQLLRDAIENNVSDIHVTTDDYVAFRTRKIIKKLDIKTSKDEVIELAKKLAGNLYNTFLENHHIDLSGEINGIRYRANMYFERGSIAIAMRVISKEIKSIIELNLPHLLFELIKKQNGLILVTGPTGCGKSTTLAAMINEINTDFSKHIITLEDPIEYIFKNKKSVIHQRELGTDFNSFGEGLRSIIRQDPDIMMIGELRDKITIQTALNASETGHLVLSTLHTSNIKSSINRITGVFSAEEAVRIRYLLADSLIAILTQKLIRTADGKGVIPAFEILINTTATANLIRNGEVGQLESYLLMDQRKGSIPMEKSIEKLIKSGFINQDDLD